MFPCVVDLSLYLLGRNGAFGPYIYENTVSVRIPVELYSGKQTWDCTASSAPAHHRPFGMPPQVRSCMHGMTACSPARTTRRQIGGGATMDCKFTWNCVVVVQQLARLASIGSNVDACSSGSQMLFG